MPRVYVETYGCQMNVADSDLMRGILGEQGYQPVDRAADADVILINTCAVREKAEERVLARAEELRAEKRRRPGVVLGITGCMAEHLKEKLLERAPWVDLIAGPDSYRRLPGLVQLARESAPSRARPATSGPEALLAIGKTSPPGRGERLSTDPTVDVRLDKRETYEGLPVPAGDGVSGFVTIQRGCDKFCTFCVVPLTRGRERATPPREVLRQVRGLAAAGAREVTLLGQTVNSYRHEEAGFADLLRAVAQVDGIERVRFTSPYPVDFSAEVIATMAAEPKVCKHVHLPLQSASDVVLERMHRGYNYADFLGIVAALRAAMPQITLTTDILVGFSGETEEDHAQTLLGVERIGFDGAFTFAYSEREGTLAARKLPDDVSDAVRGRRLAEVIALQERISAARNAAYVGRTERVLLHGVARRGGDQLIGRTDGFKAVVVPRAGHAPGDLVDVAIERATSATLFGRVVSGILAA